MKKAAFSLLELMFVFCIIAILFAIAFPQYQHYIIKAKRKNAEVTLLDLASKMESAYLENLSYLKATLGTNAETDISKIAFTEDHAYALKFVEKTKHSFLLEAEPLDVQMQKDKQCGSLRIDQLGRKAITGNGNVHDCW